MVHYVPGLKEMLLPHTIGGEIATTPKEYEQNLNRLMQELGQGPGHEDRLGERHADPRYNNEVFKLGTEIEQRDRGASDGNTVSRSTICTPTQAPDQHG